MHHRLTDQKLRKELSKIKSKTTINRSFRFTRAPEYTTEAVWNEFGILEPRLFRPLLLVILLNFQLKVAQQGYARSRSARQ